MIPVTHTSESSKRSTRREWHMVDPKHISYSIHEYNLVGSLNGWESYEFIFSFSANEHAGSKNIWVILVITNYGV